MTFKSGSQLPIVGVMGSGNVAHEQRAQRLGRWLATCQVHLLTGGGGGVMASVSRAFAEVAERAGSVIGIIPAATPESERPKAGYPNLWVEIPIYTHLALSGDQGLSPLSRNPINVLSSQVIVALPGGQGTRAEVLLAQKYRRPLVAWLRRRSEIPDLPPSVAVESRFEGIQKFVGDHLGQSLFEAHKHTFFA